MCMEWKELQQKVIWGSQIGTVIEANFNTEPPVECHYCKTEIERSEATMISSRGEIRLYSPQVVDSKKLFSCKDCLPIELTCKKCGKRTVFHSSYVNDVMKLKNHGEFICFDCDSQGYKYEL